MDANFELVRKKNAGYSIGKDLFLDSHFIDSDEVEQFLPSYGDDWQTDKVLCMT
jgi:hypothetical protein